MNNKPNPDDRSDNVEKIQEIIVNTIDNYHKAEESLKFGSEKDIKDVREKNKRREESINSLRSEVKEEAEYNKHH
ncbi:MAG: small acid-soluble spore protein Tlp [Bacillales bacterium]|jgi:small acid-soluble spore protein (thioredoxin-like protein)|nr:small acid-soluble spore protein Tlp [Bacillales bacterium]